MARGGTSGSLSTAPATQPAQAGERLERSGPLEALAAMLEGVRSTSRGRLVLVTGEAGAGKTALVRRFTDEHRGSARILWGACDALFTPRALGPLVDVAEETGRDLAQAVPGDAGAPEGGHARPRARARPAPATP